MHSLKTRHCLGATLCVVNTLFCAAQELAVSNDIGIISDDANAADMVAGWYSNDNCNQYAPTCNIKSTDGTVMSPDGTLILFQPPGTILTSSFPGSPIDGRSLAVPYWISIDQAGDIAESYPAAARGQRGFVRNPYGTMTSFDPPRGKRTTNTSINDIGVFAGSYYFDRNNQIKRFARSAISSQHNDPGSFFGALSLKRRRHTSRTHPTRPEWPQQIGVGR